MAKQLKKTLLSSCLFLVLCIEMFSLLPPKRPEHSRTQENLAKDTAANGPFTLSGALHVHVPLKVGESPFLWMKEAAEGAAIDFVVAEAPKDNRLTEGRFGNVDFFLEHSVHLPAGDLFTFSSHGSLKDASVEQLKQIALASFEGQPVKDFFSVIAHPSHAKTPWNRFDRYTDGIEVMNFESQWVRELYDAPFSYLGSLLLLPFNEFLGALRFLNPYAKDLQAWDTMNELGPGHFAVLGHDLNVPFGLLEGSFLHASLLEKSFRAGKNILFFNSPPPTEFIERKKAIYEAIQKGRLAVVFPVLYPFDGNMWSVECDGGRFFSGDKLLLGKLCQLHIQTPSSFPFARRYKIFRNGEILNEFVSRDPEFHLPLTERGAYRVEIWARTKTAFRVLQSGDTPYVFYNPIYVN